MVGCVQHHKSMLDIGILALLGIIPGDREQLALAQRLARSHVDQDQQLLQEFLYCGLVLINGLLAPSLSPAISSIQKGVAQWLGYLNCS